MASTRDARAAAFLKDVMAGHGMPVPRIDEAEAEAMRESVRAQESVAGRALGGPETARPRVSVQGLNAGLEAIEKGDSLTREQLFGIEAIIIPDKRPAMPLAKGTYTVTQSLWAHLEEPDIKTRLTTAARSIGRVEVPGSGLPYGGTAFVVGKGLLMTNRHVAEIFTAGLGLRHLDFLPGIKPGFDSSFAPDNADVPPLVVRGVKMVHP
ncbi:MAG: hypothetical protein INR70_12230, partial [Parafilimonas terrae]|nr:hypothetical protein [Parafilimonas terrae]